MKNKKTEAMINNELFYCKSPDTYPPFKNGLYLEEYFLQTEKPITKRKYIPALWTNFQVSPWFRDKKEEMQRSLDKWFRENPSEYGYFIVVQHDDGPQLKLPPNTVIYGACCGMVPIPLIYQDVENTLSRKTKIPFREKTILCSFVGNRTTNQVLPNVRETIFHKFAQNPRIVLYDSGGWTPNVNGGLQKIFINITQTTKFALAPRGYGRGSFRFYECFQLGTIPVYVWNDFEWLPYKNIIEYKRLCISIHVSELDDLESILESITETKYNEMFEYYEEIKHLFELDGMSAEIVRHVNKSI
jgi:hypothetical protein